MIKSAIVLGATGLVGREIVDLLEADPNVDRVVLLVRRAPDRAVAPKTDVRVTNFREPATFAKRLEADALFSALGTTLKVAGSEEAQYEVDYTFQFESSEGSQSRERPRDRALLLPRRERQIRTVLLAHQRRAR